MGSEMCIRDSAKTEIAVNTWRSTACATENPEPKHAPAHQSVAGAAHHALEDTGAAERGRLCGFERGRHRGEAAADCAPSMARRELLYSSWEIVRFPHW